MERSKGGKKKANVKLSEQIYQLLKRDIIECVYEPGETLQESSVRETYKIGHTPFREACARLKAEGLIQIVPHRGYFVAPFSPNLIQDLFELRLMIEPHAAFWPASGRTRSMYRGWNRISTKASGCPGGATARTFRRSYGIRSSFIP